MLCNGVLESQADTGWKRATDLSRFFVRLDGPPDEKANWDKNTHGCEVQIESEAGRECVKKQCSRKTMNEQATTQQRKMEHKETTRTIHDQFSVHGE